MDDTGWAAEGFFSPSKAKLAQAQAREWSYVDAWLNKRYASGRVPTLERNDDTLQALLSLISANEKADERRSIVERVERSALQHYAKEQQLHQESGDAVYQAITESLTQAGLAALQSVAQSSLLLSTPAKRGCSELVSAAIRLQIQTFEARQTEEQATEQLKALTHEHERLQQLFTSLRGASSQIPTDLVEQTAQWSKGQKHLRTKLVEYDERVLTAQSTSALVELLEETKKLMLDHDNIKMQLANVEDEIDAYQTISKHGHRAETLVLQARSELAKLQATPGDAWSAHAEMSSP